MSHTCFLQVAGVMAVYSSGKKGRKSNLRHIFKDDCHQKWYLRSVTGTCWWADWANTKQTAIWERCPWYVRWDKPGASAAPFVFQKGGNGRIPHITMCIGSNWASSLLFYREQLEVNRQPLTVSFNGGGALQWITLLHGCPNSWLQTFS